MKNELVRRGERVSGKCPYHSSHYANPKKTLREEKISEYNPFLRKNSEMSGDESSEGCNSGQETRLHFHSKDGCTTTSRGCAGI